MGDLRPSEPLVGLVRVLRNKCCLFWPLGCQARASTLADAAAELSANKAFTKHRLPWLGLARLFLVFWKDLDRMVFHEGEGILEGSRGNGTAARFSWAKGRGNRGLAPQISRVKEACATAVKVWVGLSIVWWKTVRYFLTHLSGGPPKRWVVKR